jgi:predicted membrane-bound mannosyltransferase
MPLQGHWARVNTPLRETTSRERRTVWIAVGLLAMAAVVAAIVAIGSSNPPIPAGCIRVDLPSTMGGGTPQLCGKAASSFCASDVAHARPLNETALPKCREAGY